MPGHFPPWAPAACICIDLVSDPECQYHHPSRNQFQSEADAMTEAEAMDIACGFEPAPKDTKSSGDMTNEGAPVKPIPQEDHQDESGYEYVKGVGYQPNNMTDWLTSAQYEDWSDDELETWTESLEMQDALEEMTAYCERLEEDNDALMYNQDKLIEALEYIAAENNLEDAKQRARDMLLLDGE